MQKDLSNAAHHRDPGPASLAGVVGVLVVLLVALAVASYPRVAVGATIGVAAAVLLRRWYTQVDTPGTSTPTEREGDGERGRTEQRDPRLANGRG